MDESNNNPRAPRSVASEPADANPPGVASSEPALTCRRGEPEGCFPDREPALNNVHGPAPSSSPTSPNAPSPEATAVSVDPPKPARVSSLPISLPSFFLPRSRVPSASIAPSTAEGKPILSTDPAGDRRTSALQELNSKFPSASRNRGHTPDVSGAQSSTYSRPVLVRTYSGPSPARGSRGAQSRHYRPPSGSRALSQRLPLAHSSPPGSGGPGEPIQPALSDVGVGTTSSAGAGFDGYRPGDGGGSVYGVNMLPSAKAKKAATANSGSTGGSCSGSGRLTLLWPWSLSSRQEPEKPKLPPLEAFSFKSFLADLEARGTDNDISADLDRIAEICARSRYSLSNQYEVHVAPHGSGASFTPGALFSSSRTTRGQGHSHSRSRSRSRGRGHAQGPTLQVITSDDENLALLPHPKGGKSAGGQRRRSTAYGTLETIMSSSRSSEAGKATKKPSATAAAALASEVRGRAARKACANNPGASAASGSSFSVGNAPTAANATTDRSNGKPARRKSASFATAIMDTSNSSSGRSSSSSSRGASGQTTTATTTAPGCAPPTSSASRRQQQQQQQQRQQTTTRTRAESASALLSDPALPQTSAGPAPSRGDGDIPSPGASGGGGRREPGTAGDGGGLVGSWGSWIPWRTTGQAVQHHQRQQGKSSAEGRLRQLLMSGGDGGGTRQVRVSV
ncbi:hypothetical protein VTH06DRAFT_6953 [Thermothelomyces fergusii]